MMPADRAALLRDLLEWALKAELHRRWLDDEPGADDDWLRVADAVLAAMETQ